jgi:secondary thiamine-phosphate synthase enzyme
METFRKVLSLSTDKEGDIIDLTGEVKTALARSKMQDGLACVFVPHSTAAIYAIENEPGLQSDMKGALQRLFPKGMAYGHSGTGGGGNGHSHIRASFLGPSMTVPFNNGALDLGIWQQLVLMELDNGGRDRKVIIQLIGSQKQKE